MQKDLEKTIRHEMKNLGKRVSESIQNEIKHRLYSEELNLKMENYY